MLLVFSSFFEGFADASAYQITALFLTTAIATFSNVYRLKALLTPRFNRQIVFASLISFYTLGNFLEFAFTLGLLGKGQTIKLTVTLCFLISNYAFPFLFKEKYFDTFYLVACVKIISSVHLLGYFPYQFLSKKYGFDINTEGIIASALSMLGVLFAIFIVKKFLLPRLDKTPKAVKISLFAIYVIMDLMTTVANGGFKAVSNSEFVVVGILFVIAMSIAIFLVTKTIKEKEDEAKILTAMYYESDKYAYYRQIEQKNLEIRQLSHDINNHLATIRNLSENIEDESVYKYVNELISDYDKATPSFCANRIADAVLVHEMQNAREKGVKLVISVQIPQEFFVSSVDLVSLISNIIDNAVEASQSSNEKAVDFKAFCDKHSFNIICKNTYTGELKKNGKKLLTTKQNSDNHGLGIEIIKKVVEKYNGKYNTEYSENEFNAVVYLPY
jgi:sensor histidine kinase YesM